MGVNTKMHKITRIITYTITIKQFWLAENECIFHVTLVQRRQVTNSPLSFYLCLNVLWCFFHLNYGLVKLYCLLKLTRAYSHQIALEIMFYLHEQNSIILCCEYFFLRVTSNSLSISFASYIRVSLFFFKIFFLVLIKFRSINYSCDQAFHWITS